MAHPVCDSHFLPLLSDYRVERLQATPGAVFGMWPDLTLAYLNPGWFDFAAENGGEPQISTAWGLGRNILEAIPEPLQAFFQKHYRRCIDEDRPWTHLYECSTADKFRKFYMKVVPLVGAKGFLVVNSLCVEVAQTRSANPPLEEAYRNSHGFVEQCCHCRRVRRVVGDGNWDWVPDWVRQIPPSTSHTFCETCFGFYYGESERHRSPPQIFLTEGDNTGDS